MADVPTKALQERSDTGRDRAVDQREVLARLFELEGPSRPTRRPRRAID